MRVRQRMAALRPSDAVDPEADIGPMISARTVERLRDLVDDAVAHGARVVLPGGLLDGPGHFFAPVVLTDVPAEARLMREEIFGRSRRSPPSTARPRRSPWPTRATWASPPTS